MKWHRELTLRPEEEKFPMKTSDRVQEPKKLDHHLEKSLKDKHFNKKQLQMRAINLTILAL